MPEAPAYIHPQGIAPDGLWFERRKVADFLRRDVIAVCDDCTERYPADPSYMIVGDDDEEEKNLRIVEAYEVKGYKGT